MSKLLKALLKGIIIWFVSVLTLILLITYFMGSGNSGDLSESEIVILNINGVIGSADDVMGVDGISGEKILKSIYQLRKSKKLKVLILRVNSGGGTLPGTQEIHLELEKLKKDLPHVKIVSSISEIAASGAYYIITLSDIIYANPGSMVGNIGVISTFPNAQKLMEKLGIEFEIMKKGKYKDIGAWWRKMEDYEKASMAKISDAAMEMFIEVVIAGRCKKIQKIKEFKDKEETVKYIRSLCNGEVFLGVQAKENGLIDEIGNFYDAYDYAKDATGQKKPKVHVISGKGSMISKLLGLSGYIKQMRLFNMSGKVML
ncbi:signal peptide peptidase SppA [bacterium]|nr:signal peptide peptidase SppA [bacterium]